MSARERLTLAVAFAVVLGAAAVVPLYSDLDWVLRAAGAIAAIAAAGIACRRANVPGVLQPVATTAALFAYVCLVFARTTLALGLLPTRHTLSVLSAQLQAGLTDIDRLAPPVPSNTGLALIAVLGIGAVAIAVDLVAVVLGRAAAAGLPLLVLFAVPSAVLPGGLGWIPFVFVAAGWLSLMLVEGSDRVSRWGTPLKTDRPDRTARYDDTSLGRVGRRIGAAALGIAVFVPALIPGLNARLLGGGGGDGTGNGSHTTTTYNPITRMRDDLRLPKPHDVLTYRTTATTPDYLRMTTLDRFSDGGWSSSRLSGNTKANGVKGNLPAPVGLGPALTTEQVTITVHIRDLDAQWLPAPAVPSRVDVSGPWLYDKQSETVYAIRTGTKKLTKPYTITSVHVVPDRAALAASSGPDTPPEIRQQYATLPDVTPFVQKLTDRIIAKANAQTPYAKVAAIQAFFSPANLFTYSTSATVPGIDSASALEAFLRGRQGFCEQYASAMAAMIRLEGVPARVAVGFTMGTRQRDGSYRVTTDDAHAWPEAWFAGAGWVRFEPTPRTDGQAVVPPYATANGGDTGTGASSGPDLPQKGPASSSTDSQLALHNKLDRLDNAPQVAPPAQQTQKNHGFAALVLLALALLLVVLATPRVVHVARRRHRWRSRTADAGWQQVHDDALDLGHLWRPADSPRAAAAALSQRYALDAAARAALSRLALAAERSRYSRDGVTATAGLHDDSVTVRAALRHSVGRRARVRAWLLPASTLRWMSSTTGTFVADVLDAFDNAWSTVRTLGRARTRAV